MADVSPPDSPPTAPGYPKRCEVAVRLRDGTAVELRPIRPDDDEREERFFRRVSAESVYWRFFHSKRMLSADEVRHLTTVDYEERMALVAVHEGEMVAVGRYDVIPGRAGGRVAEVAFLVEDDFQGRGLGMLLLRHLTSYALSKGISSFEAHILASNHPMLRLFRAAGYTLTPRAVPDAYTVEFPEACSTPGKPSPPPPVDSVGHTSTRGPCA